MGIQPLRYFGDPVLRTPAEPVTSFDADLRRLVTDLVDTMHAEQGAGLAAPQIGVGLRVFVYSCEGESGHLVNPTIEVVGEQEQVGPEGCLSIPDLRYDTRRPRHVVARGFDQHGAPIELAGSDFLARALQHETDHLDGVLFLDRLEPDLRRRAMAEIRAAAWFAGATAPSGPSAPAPTNPLFGTVR